MTYDRQENVELQSVLTTVCDKLDTMTNWSIVHDDRANGHISVESRVSGEYFVFESKHMGEGTSGDPLRVEAASQYTDPSTYTKVGGAAIKNVYKESPTDSFDLWTQYSDRFGFVIYLRRTVGDGKDYSWWAGAQQYDGEGGQEYWDPRSAEANSNPIFHYAVGDGKGENNGSVNNKTSWGSTSQPTPPNGVGSNGRQLGLLNPDNNFTDFVWWSNHLLKAKDVQDTDTGKRTPFARISDPLWLGDKSGSDVNTGDVVQNSNGTNEWELLDYHGNRVWVRMI